MIDILLVEDHEELANLICAFLNKKGFSLWHAIDAESALTWLHNHTVQIVLLDITLPNMDGFGFCKALRAKSDVPILILSARSHKSDKLLGYELGADDYMEKPIDPDLLAAKIQALLSRFDAKRSNGVIRSGALHIDPAAHKVYFHQKPLELNVKEFELLLLFVRNTGKTLHKEYLFDQIWGADSDSENQTLTVHIKMLRTKIEENPRQPQRILTVWGVGYRYEEV